MHSSFTSHGPRTQPDSLALLQLRRDHITPVRLSSDPNANLNTRFGSYPHITLLGVPWGSQVRASRIKTAHSSAKRVKRQKTDGGQEITQVDNEQDPEALVVLGSADAGFAHVLPPTPEFWTKSLPHRTQVVYTPDYSYILQRLGVRPGSVIIEAGAGSGSFTHAAARAVYDGPSEDEEAVDGDTASENWSAAGRQRRTGKVYSYEYHKPRAEQLIEEIHQHNMEDVVTVTHRDVYEDGFLIDPASSSSAELNVSQPQATAIFLDLPAPWLALKHLQRAHPSSSITADDGAAPPAGIQSPLSSEHAVNICTFSPCIEQVQQTVTELARLGWSAIETVTLTHHDIITRRERVGIAEEGSRDGNPSPATVEEAVAHLRATREAEESARRKMIEREARGERKRGSGKVEKSKTCKERRVEGLQEVRKGRSLWREGRLVSRTESELKGHTSYLTFALLPQTWSDDDEARAASRVETELSGPSAGEARQKKDGGPPDSVRQSMHEPQGELMSDVVEQS